MIKQELTDASSTTDADCPTAVPLMIDEQKYYDHIIFDCTKDNSSLQQVFKLPACV